MEHTFLLSVTDKTNQVSSITEQDKLAALDTLQTVQAGEDQYKQSLGWHSTEYWAGEEALNRYESLANQIRVEADAFVVIGIGGSNQAARAIISALEPSDGPEILWTGNTISSHSMKQVLIELDKYKSVFVNVIAKNFETLEPGVAFRILRQYLQKRYPVSWVKRVVATGTPGSHLEKLCLEHHFTFLPFPENIGGRFTALSPIGLFPMAVAGVDIRHLAQGASEMETMLKTDCTIHNPALQYALIRNALYQKGYRMEMLAFFEPRLYRFAKWWVQLFGESEGKQSLGLYPIIGSYSEDLHSIGQFVQEGTPVIFETFITLQQASHDLTTPSDEVDDRFGYLNSLDLDSINDAACRATIDAHSQVFPCIKISVDTIDAFSLGQLLYFFQFSCYLSGTLLGVNPFDQPGVEAYKNRMFKILGK